MLSSHAHALARERASSTPRWRTRLSVVPTHIKYRALPAQLTFHQDNLTPFLAYIGGFGSGKTYALAMKSLLLSQLNAPIPVGLIVPTIPMMKRDLLPVLEEEILNPQRVPYVPNRVDHTYFFPGWGGSLHIASAERPDSIKGPSWGAVGYNEPGIMKHAAYRFGLSRARHPRARFHQVFLAGTPESFNWLYDEFEKGPAQEQARRAWRKSHRVIRASSRENTFLPDWYVPMLESNYDSRLVQAYVEGRFVLLIGGRVYYGFDRVVHVNPAVRIDRKVPLCWSWDFNLNPFSTIVAQVKGRMVYAVDEVVVPGANTVDVIAEFKRRGYHNHPAGVRIYGDAEALRRTSVSDYQIIRDAGFKDIRVPNANPLVRARTNLVNGFLRNSLGEVRLYVSPRCQELILDLEQVVYDKYGEIGKANPKRTHTSDALGYLLHREFPPDRRGRVVFLNR